MSKWFIAFALALAGATLAHAQPALHVGGPRPGGLLFEGDFAQSKARTIEFLKAQSQITQSVIGCIQAAATSVDVQSCHEKALPQRKAVMEKFQSARGMLPALGGTAGGSPAK